MRIAALAAMVLATAITSLVIADRQDRGNLLPPSIAVDDRGLSTVAWTEVARAGIRIAQESEPGRWSRPRLLDPTGGPGSVAVDGTRLAHVAYAGPDGLIVADQLRRPDRGASVFRRKVVDRRGVGRPSIAITKRGGAAVLYETDSGRLRVALRGRSGMWRTRATGVSAGQPRLAASGARRFVVAGLDDFRVAQDRTNRSGLRRGDAFRNGGSVVPSGPLRGFDLTTAGGRPLISYIDEELQIVVVARPDEGANRLGVVAATSAVGNFTAVAGAPSGRAAVLFRDARFGVLSLAVLQGGSRSPELTVGPGQSGDIAIEPDGERAHLAYWDPGGRKLYGARAPLDRARLSPDQAIFNNAPAPAHATVAAVSILQPTLPVDGKIAIWLASLALLLTILAGTLLLLERRRGIRLLPFGIVLVVLAGFAVRGAYVAEVGIYGLPPNDLLTLDRDGVTAVVDALLIVSAATAILCIVGSLPPVGWGGRVLQRLGAVSLPSRRGAGWVLAVFLGVSLAVAAYLLRSDGIEALLQSRQTAFAEKGYQLAMLSAGAGAWLVYFAVTGWPARRREQALLGVSAGLALIPLLLSGARSVSILGFMVPIVLLIHLCVRPIRLRTAIIGVACLLVFAVGTRELTRGGTASPYLDEATPTEEADGAVVKALKPVLGWTEAAGLDALVLVRTEYVPRFGTDPLLTPGAFVGIAVPRSLWPDKPRSAMDTFSLKLKPWNYALSKVGQTTTLAGEFTMDWGLPGVFIGFAAFALLLCLLGELLAGTGGMFGVLVAVALLPRVGAAMWGDSFNAGWGGIVLTVMIGLAIAGGHVFADSASSESRRGRPMAFGRRNTA